MSIGSSCDETTIEKIQERLIHEGRLRLRGKLISSQILMRLIANGTLELLSKDGSKIIVTLVI